MCCVKAGTRRVSQRAPCTPARPRPPDGPGGTDGSEGAAGAGRGRRGGGGARRQSLLSASPQITQLKIDNNPFAKGFRDTGNGRREKR